MVARGPAACVRSEVGMALGLLGLQVLLGKATFRVRVRVRGLFVIHNFHDEHRI